MKIDKQKISAIVSLPDEEMWREIVAVGSSYGLSIPKETPSHEELEKIRSIACGRKINMIEAMKLVNKFKRG